MYAWRPPRTLSITAAVGIVALVGAALIVGLGARAPLEASQSLVSVSFTRPPAPPPMPPPSPPRQREEPKAKASPSAPAIHNQATPIVAPAVKPLIVPPLVASIQAGSGAAPANGASSQWGPGQGAGGAGNGLGGGGYGGDGDGEAVVGPSQIGGGLSYRDLPRGILAFGQEAAVHVQFTVTPNGRASNCRATRPSGYPAIDAITCGLVVQRFRFRPARDAYGRPVRAEVEETHTWIERFR